MRILPSCLFLDLRWYQTWQHAPQCDQVVSDLVIAEARRNGNLLDLRVVEMEKEQNYIVSRVVVTFVPR